MEGCMSCMYFYIQNAVRWCCGIQHMQMATHEKIGGAFFPSILPRSPWSFPLISILHTFFSVSCKSHSDFGRNPLLVPLYSTFFILYPFTSLSKSGEIPSFDLSVYVCLSLVTSIPPFFSLFFRVLNSLVFFSIFAMNAHILEPIRLWGK